MAFDVYRSVGPQVDVSLFGDAAARGTSIGKAIPSFIESAVEGVKEGIQYGQKYRQREINIAETEAQLEGLNQQNVIRQHQIDTLSIEDQIREAQLKNQKAIAEQNVMETFVKQQTEANAIKASNQKLEAEFEQQKLISQDFSNKSKIDDSLAQGSPEGINNILGDKGLFGTFFRDPDYGLKVFGAIKNSPAATDTQKNEATKYMEAIKNQQVQVQLAALQAQANADSLKAFAKAKQELPKDSTLSFAMNKYRLSEADFASGRVEAYPAGVKPIGPDGKLDRSKPDNKVIAGPTGQNDLFVDGFKVEASLSDSGFGVLQSIKSGYSAAGLSVPATIAPQATAAPVASNSDRSWLGLFNSNSKESPKTPVVQTNGGPPPSLVPAPETGTAKITNTGNQIVNQAGARLVAEANSNPDLRQRLIAKGLIMPTPTVLSNQTPQPTPTAANEPTPAPVTETPKEVETPRATPEPAQIKATVSRVRQDLGQKIEEKVIKTVLTHPDLQGLSPIEKGIVAVESSGNPNAKSPTGPVGFFQLTEAAAQDMGVNRNIPKENIKGGREYFGYLYGKYGSNTPVALLAYNIGPGTVDKAIQQTGSSEFLDVVEGIKALKNQGYRPKALTDAKLKEAFDYPHKVLAYALAFQGLSV